jgi:hypothetical protein
VVGEPLLGFKGVLSGIPEREKLQKLRATKNKNGRKR